MPNNDNRAIVEVLLIAFRIYCEGVPSAEDIRKMLDDKPLYKRLLEREEDCNAFLWICELAILQARAVVSGLFHLHQHLRAVNRKQVQELRKARGEIGMLEARNKVLELELENGKLKREES